jgi:hypothetical protein
MNTCILLDKPAQWKHPNPKEPPTIQQRRAFRIEHALKMVIGSHEKGSSNINALVLSLAREALRQ